jgi:hypothetical protein
MADRSGYIGRAPGDSSVVIARQTFSPTGIQTDFTFASGYVVGYLDLYLNGARLIEGQDFTATDGSVVGLTTYAQNGDVLELVAYKAFNLAIPSATGSLSVGGDLTVSGVTSSVGGFNIGIQSGGTDIATGPITAINFIGVGNTLVYNSSLKTVDVSIQGGAGGTWASYNAGIATSKSIGVNTTTLDDPDLVGAGNSFQGVYISNGMIIFDNVLNGDHYIGTNFNGLIAGPVTIGGTLTIDGNYVVV